MTTKTKTAASSADLRAEIVALAQDFAAGDPVKDLEILERVKAIGPELGKALQAEGRRMVEESQAEEAALVERREAKEAESNRQRAVCQDLFDRMSLADRELRAHKEQVAEVDAQISGIVERRRRALETVNAEIDRSVSDPEQVLIDALMAEVDIAYSEADCRVRFGGLRLKTENVASKKIERIFDRSKESARRVRQSVKELNEGRRIRGVTVMG